MAPTSPLTRVWRPAWPCPVGVVLAPLRHGAGDPTFKRGPDGSVWRGTRTPEGTATIRILADPTSGTVTGEAWGEGAAWTLEAMPRMLGAEDDPSGFVP